MTRCRPMSRAAIALMIGICIVARVGAGGRQDSSGAPAQIGYATLQVGGIPNVLTAAVVEAALRDIPGVHSAQVSYQSRRASIEFDQGQVQRAGLVRTITGFSPYKVALLPEFTRTATIRIPELVDREIGNNANLALSRLPGIVGGTISTGMITVDYDARVVSAQEIASAVADDTSLTPSGVDMPASDDPAPEDSAQVVVRIPSMADYRAALAVAEQVNLIGIFDADFDIAEQTLSVIYEIKSLTAPKIIVAIESAAGEAIELITIDKAGKAVWLNRRGWFVFVLSLLGLPPALGLYMIIRRFRSRAAN